MNEPKEYLASYITVKQIGPDDWGKFQPSLKVTADTTIGDIVKWIQRYEKLSDERFKHWELDVRITDLNKL